jgi:hypothetical protein
MWKISLFPFLLGLIVIPAYSSMAAEDYTTWPGKDGVIKTDIDLPVTPFLGYGLSISNPRSIEDALYNIWFNLPEKKSSQTPSDAPGAKGSVRLFVYHTIDDAQFHLRDTIYTSQLDPKRIPNPQFGDVAFSLDNMGYTTLYWTRMNVLVSIELIADIDSSKVFGKLGTAIDEIIRNAPTWKTGDPRPRLNITQEFFKTFPPPPR